jgi:regulatory protein
VDEAYIAGLKMLARRELSEAQLRTRLARRKFDPNDIGAAIDRLRHERAVDDRRVALACARTETRLRQRGRARVVRQIEALGIGRDIARAAVAEVFGEVDEAALLEQALEKRLRRGPSLADEAAARRIHRYLIGQGFEPSRVTTLLESRIRSQESRIANPESRIANRESRITNRESRIANPESSK